jgi:hypothetical protein
MTSNQVNNFEKTHTHTMNDDDSTSYGKYIYEE